MKAAQPITSFAYSYRWYVMIIGDLVDKTCYYVIITGELVDKALITVPSCQQLQLSTRQLNPPTVTISVVMVMHVE